MKTALELLLLIVVAGCSPGSPTLVNLPSGSGKSLSLEIRASYGGKPPAASFSVTEPSSVEAILSVLRQGVAQTDHKCGDIGSVTITFADGQTATIQILPGHKPEHYEFRYQRDNYWVYRHAFLSALEKAGVDITAIPRDCN